MKVHCVADLHGYQPELPGGDLLIIAGDLVACDRIQQYMQFGLWLDKQNYVYKVVVPGNHDVRLQKADDPLSLLKMGRMNADVGNYLCDSAVELGINGESYKLWGSPWTQSFPGMNPACMAYTCATDNELAEKWALIPDDVEVLVTHGPAWDLLDMSSNLLRCGSLSLRERIQQLKHLKLHVFGHLHEGHGHVYNYDSLPLQDAKPVVALHVNCSYVDAQYQPVHGISRIMLHKKMGAFYGGEEVDTGRNKASGRVAQGTGRSRGQTHPKEEDCDGREGRRGTGQARTLGRDVEQDAQVGKTGKHEAIHGQADTQDRENDGKSRS